MNLNINNIQSITSDNASNINLEKDEFDTIQIGCWACTIRF
jgi:hypothetical protein